MTQPASMLKWSKWLSRSLRITCLIGPVLLGGACIAGMPEPASPETASAGAGWKRSDVLFSPRYYRPNWEAAFRAYGANRIVWTLSGPQYISAARGIARSVQCQFPPWVPKQRPGWEQMACHKADGSFVQWKLSDGKVDAVLVFPDTNTPGWRAYMKTEVGKLVAAGCRDFQQDDPGMNYNQAWRGGCYAPGETAMPAKRMSEIQRRATEDYYTWLHETTQALVRAADSNATATFSANIQTYYFKDRAWLADKFDFFEAEIVSDRAKTPETLLEFYEHAKARKVPSAITLPTDDAWRIRRGTASGYALGLLPIVPWDVFTGFNGPRFYGDPEKFADMYQFVRQNPQLFDPYDHGDAGRGSLPGIYLAHGRVTAIDRTQGDGTARLEWAPFGVMPDLSGVSTVQIAGRDYVLRAPLSSKMTLVVDDAPALRAGMPVFIGRSGSIISLRRAQTSALEILHLALWDETPPTALVLDGQRAAEFRGGTVLRPAGQGAPPAPQTAAGAPDEDHGYVVYSLKPDDEWVIIRPKA